MSPVDFIVCWTPGGEMVGGTATALAIAEDHGRPILNLGLDAGIETIETFLESNINE